VAVEVVRTLCGSVGLIAAVPLTTLLAATLAAPEAEAEAEGGPAGHGTGVPAGRVPYSPRRGLAPEAAASLFGHVLALHEPWLSHAAVGTGGLSGLETLPADARRAVVELKRLPAGAAGGPWYRRAMQAGTASLDLRDPGQLDLLRRYGPYSTDARVWVEDDPAPVIECTETLDGEPRVGYRLDPDELERLRVALGEAGLADITLVPRRTRARVGHGH
jgi:hypothetical protein